MGLIRDWWGGKKVQIKSQCSSMGSAVGVRSRLALGSVGVSKPRPAKAGCFVCSGQRRSFCAAAIEVLLNWETWAELETLIGVWVFRTFSVLIVGLRVASAAASA